MSSDEPKDESEKLQDETKESIEKARNLLDDFKTVQEHESRVLEDQSE